MTQSRTILHIGPPKTGTTTFQELVFPALKSVCFMGKPWWNPTVPYEKCVALHRAIDSVTKAAHSYDQGAAKVAVDDWLAHAPAAQPLPDGSLLPRFLSEERLSFTDVVSMDEIARRLAALFPRAEIVYTRRDRVAGLRSFHRWLYAHAWINTSFSDWLVEGIMLNESDLAGVALRSYDWKLIETSFGAHFPSVRWGEFSDMFRSPQAFLRTTIGVESEEFSRFELLVSRRLNESPGRAVSELHRAVKKAIRLWNQLPLAKIDEKREYLGDTPLWRALETPLRPLRWGESKLAATDADRERIAAYYAARDASGDPRHSPKLGRAAKGN
ncbi:hypothetical protein NIM87_07745 [Devosia sp. XJ19-1]|uniref:Sulfotransferase domain-containing protein n=1 Tax=Devosia ureilytica TaxID=2952754 RepID=A0A9Q4AMC4_9HYPH|nr:hypothetical protein [Devosia ureilytica]MCP8883386.1 hypothetical protein [Devosia ureilytica]MCP8886246.1 hypothetical protein [Devosia ureilytica]